MPVHDLRKEGPAVGARANQEENDGQYALEVEDCRLERERIREREASKHNPAFRHILQQINNMHLLHSSMTYYICTTSCLLHNSILITQHSSKGQHTLAASEMSALSTFVGDPAQLTRQQLDISSVVDTVTEPPATQSAILHFHVMTDDVII